MISVLSNVAPKETHDMVMKFLEGDIKGAAKIQIDAIPLINALFCEVNPIPAKAALNMMGMEAGPLRMPLSEMEDSNKEILAKAMRDFGISSHKRRRRIMIKVLMYGCCGHMGRVISELAGKDPEVEIVAGVDIADKGNTSYPVYTDIRACQEQVDVVVDFSSAKAVDALLDYCGEKGLPVVLCTTGLSEDQLAKVEETAKKTAVLKSAICPWVSTHF